MIFAHPVFPNLRACPFAAVSRLAAVQAHALAHLLVAVLGVAALAAAGCPTRVGLAHRVRRGAVSTPNFLC